MQISGHVGEKLPGLERIGNLGSTRNQMKKKPSESTERLIDPLYAKKGLWGRFVQHGGKWGDRRNRHFTLPTAVSTSRRPR
jgi:hypothetical protein